MVKVWDSFIRGFHWGQLLLLIGCWWSAEAGEMVWHQWLAMTLLAFWLTRILWGFVGSASARFSHFVVSPAKAFAYGRALARGQAPATAGHNPLGGWMVLVLLAVVGIQLGSGLFASDEIFTEGPLSHLVSSETATWLTRLHHLNFDFIVWLGLAHLLAVILHCAKGERLVPAMFTGRKRGIDGPSQVRASWPAWFCFLLLWGLLYWSWGSGL
ncbi:cytochrome b/b6 domain-containing protein [Gallaecimonas pentaromativorans]|uniref:cytochrome b/b6 domain-containing protein n=1 Tax=Gallaecimonas pentaromativorans TaxID=584787 RepID=UPI003A902051